jgi:5-hydroxyisourate hydrolase
MQMAGLGRLTTHVLDTTHGRPAAGVRVELLRVQGEQLERLLSTQTNADGRTDGPLLEGEQFQLGTYELVFHVGQYFQRLSTRIEHPFLDVVPVRFGLAEDKHYHVPLLVSPFGYSTYRGS